MEITRVKFNMHIDSGNQAIVDYPTSAIGNAFGRILRELCQIDVSQCEGTAGNIRDENGNSIGHWELELEHDAATGSED